MGTGWSPDGNHGYGVGVLNNSILTADQGGFARAAEHLQGTGREIRDQIREHVREQVQAAQRDRATTPTPPAPPAPQHIVITPGGPAGTEAIVGVQPIPFDPNLGIPPAAVDISLAFFFTIAAIIIGLPISRAFARRMDRKATPQVPPEVSSQLTHLAQSVDAIALEVERISEGQRFVTRLLSEQRESARHALPAGPDH